MSVIRNELLLAGGDEAYNIQRSLRLRGSASPYLGRTPSVSGNRRTFTISYWLKRGILGTTQYMFSAGNGTTESTWFTAGTFDTNGSSFDSTTSGTWVSSGGQTTAVFRDTSAWYHFVYAFDTTQASASNRVKLWVNGVQQTLSTPTITQNADLAWNASGVAHYIGARIDSGPRQFFDGYLAEIHSVDGQALTPSSFGENNAQTGVWQPKRYTGSYGTNGFYLPFTNIASTSTLGNDFSGNGNNWTTNNFSLTSGATYDSMTDVPTLTSATQANYSVMNPLDEGASGSTISNGNLTVATASTGFRYMGNTIWASSGKFYAEFTLTATSGFAQVGIATTTTNSNKTLGQDSTSWSYNSWNGTSSNNSSASTFGNSWTTNDVIGIALDKDTNKLYFSKNGTWQNSADPAAGTGSISISSIAGIPTLIGVCDNDNGGSATFQANFGQRPFAYTPPTGFVALNTFNLPTPTIGATASTQANKYFDAKTYTGTGATQTITVDFAPDFAWLKRRDGAGANVLLDRLRLTGSLPNRLFSNLTDAESTAADGQNSFSSTGIVLDGSGGGGGEVNTSGRTYVAWQWNAGGSTVTNTSGSISSQVRANPSAGFSIVTYTGNGSNPATIGHGLGVAPRMVITKSRNGSGLWFVMSQSANSGAGQNGYLVLNQTGAFASDVNAWNNTSPTSSVFTVGSYSNANGTTYVAYCFAEVAGYSRFGSYTGNGSDDGVFVFTGFRPRFVIIKRTDSTGTWWVFDTARSQFNVINNELYANTSQAEGTGVNRLDTVSNGFKIRIGSEAQINANGGTYIYYAVAENPFKYSLAR